MEWDGQLVLDIYEVFEALKVGVMHVDTEIDYRDIYYYFCTYLEKLNSCVGYFESVWDFVKLPYEVDSISSSSSIEHFISIFNGPFTKMK